jgi:hypothetical protein
MALPFRIVHRYLLSVLKFIRVQSFYGSNFVVCLGV